MKRFFVLALLAGVLILAGCESEAAEDTAGITEPTGDNLTAITNTDATVVEDATVAKALLDQTLGEVITILQNAEPVSGSAGISPNATSSYDDTYNGPEGGTATSRGSVTQTMTDNAPEDDEELPALPFTLRMAASVSANDTATFEGFKWSNAASVVYQLDGTANTNASIAYNLNATIEDADASGTPSQFSGSVSSTIQAQMAYAFTIQPASGAGNAAQIVLYINTSDQFDFTFDQNDDQASFEEGPPIGEIFDANNWDITGSLKVFNSEGTMVDEIELTSAQALDYLGLLEMAE